MTGKLIVIVAASVATVFGMFLLGKFMDGGDAEPARSGSGGVQ